MDYEFEKRWQDLLKHLGKQFGEELDLQAVLFLIGVQELGQGSRKFKKNEKLDLMHIAICTLLEPYGYYTAEGVDKDGWPHFTSTAKLPNLAAPQQQQLIKEAILEYFSEITRT